MRARELLDEDYNDNLKSDLDNFLIGARGTGIQEINTRDLITQLRGMGYSVDENSIMSLLSQNPSVSNATPTMITMAEPEGTNSNGDVTQDTAARVSDMAQSATKIG